MFQHYVTVISIYAFSVVNSFSLFRCLKWSVLLESVSFSLTFFQVHYTTTQQCAINGWLFRNIGMTTNSVRERLAYYTKDTHTHTHVLGSAAGKNTMMVQVLISDSATPDCSRWCGSRWYIQKLENCCSTRVFFFYLQVWVCLYDTCIPLTLW